MHAFQVERHDAPPRLVRIARPEPGPGEALVRVAAAGLNFADLLMAKGSYQDTPAPPFTLGMELAGTVEALGAEAGATAPVPGTRVMAFTGRGALAEWAVVPAARCLPLPETMTFEEAAGFAVAYGTGHLALSRRAALAPGETLLVTGAAGGTGLTAVEIGARMGATVIAAARGAEKLAAARAAGAHHLVDTATADLRAEVKALGGADVVYETVGGESFTAALRACRPEGRILAIGFASGEVPQIPANHLLVKNLSVIGLWWGGYLNFAPQALDGSLSELLGWYAEGGLRPPVGQVLPLARAAEGLDLIRQRKAVGKIVVQVPG